MKISRIIELGLLHALGAVTYVAIVAYGMSHVEGSENSSLPETFFITGFLLLFSASAAVMASLVFLRPVLWYLGGRKKEAILLLLVTVGCIALVALGILSILVFGYR